MFVLVFCTVAGYAQKLKKGSLDFLKNEKELNVVFDYSNVIFKFEDGIDEDKYVERQVIMEGEQWKKDWVNLKDSIKAGCLHSKFIKDFNIVLFDEGFMLRVGVFPSANYQIVIKVNEIVTGKNAGPFSDDPNMSVEVSVTSLNSTNVLANVQMKKTTGKPFSNTLGRIETVYENIGKDLGKFIVKKIK